MNKIAIITVNYKTPWHLRKNAEALFKYTENFHWFIVQNSKDKESLELVRNLKRRYPQQITLVENQKNIGYVAGVNAVYDEVIKFPKACLLNSDVIVTKDWLKNLDEALESNPENMQVSPESNAFYPDGLFMKVIKRMPKHVRFLSKYQYLFPVRYKGELYGFREVNNFLFFCGGFCNLFRTEPLKNLGYILDENIVHGYHDDFDMSYYLSQFGKVGSTSKSYVFHFTNASFNKNKSNYDIKTKLMNYNGYYIFNKWESRLKEDINKLGGLKFVEQFADSYVLQDILKYFGLKESVVGFEGFVKSMPAREIGKEFLK